MQIRTDFSAFWSHVKRISTDVADFKIALEGEFEPIDRELRDGKEIDLSAVQPHNGLLSYEGRQVLLFISDHGKNVLAAKDDPEAGRRFHVAECSTLEDMRQRGRFERYIATNNTSGVFRIVGTDMSGHEELSFDVPLMVCINCLKRINYKNYRHASRARLEIWRPFSIADFFNNYSTSFKKLPATLGRGNSSSTYSADWPEISAQVRREANYCCEQCRVNLSAHPSTLHVHHVNGVKNDNRRENLRPLCADCHRKQPMHDHMFVSAKDMAIITKLRREQGILAKAMPEVYRLADLSVHGVIGHAEANGWEMPEVGFEIADHSGQVVAELELAWPNRRVGVYLHEKPPVPGWTLQNPAEFLGPA